jgi:capsular exopolysaccharide synthesis family protein
MSYRDLIARAQDPEGTGDVVQYRRQELVATQIVAGAPDDVDDNASQFWRMLQVLLRRRWTILAVLALGASYASYAAWQSTPLYAATATLEVQPQESQLLEGGNVQPLAVADAEFMGTQYELIKSRALAEQVAQDLNLVADARYADQSASLPDRLSQAAGYVVRALSAGAVARSRIIELRVQGADAGETARIANAVAEGFIQMNLDRHYNATASAREFLEERLKVTKTSLEEAERRLVQYSRENGIVDLSSVGGSEIGSSLDASSLVALNASFTAAQEARLAAEQQLRAAKADPDALSAAESPAAATLRQTLSDLTAQYRQLSSTFLPEYPAMMELNAKITAIRESLEQERANRIGTLESEYRAALAREAGLLERVDELKEQVQTLRDRSIDYNILAREVDTLRANYDALLQRFKEISIAGGAISSQVSILDKAKIPIIPFAPNILSSFVRAILASLVIGIILALAIDYIDDTIKTPDDVKKKLKLAVIGVIPRVKLRTPADKRLPRSVAAEAFASARIALQFATPIGAPRSLLVTGVRPAEGKTSTVVGLALAFVGIGKRVLIIDADMRQPSFTAAGQGMLGLSGLLTSHEKLANHFVTAETANLFLLPAGTKPPNPAELLSGPRISEIIEEARELFDIVIVDSPPVLNFADGPVLSSVCDGTLLILQSGAIRGPLARHAVERLVGANGHILGALLTKVDFKKADFGYGYNSSNYGKTGFGFSGAARKRKVEILARSEAVEPPASGELGSP